LDFELYASHILFNIGLCLVVLGDEGGPKYFEEAINAVPMGTTLKLDLFQVKQGIKLGTRSPEQLYPYELDAQKLYRPQEDNVDNAKKVDYLGKSRVIAGCTTDNFSGFSGRKVKELTLGRNYSKKNKRESTFMKKKMDKSYKYQGGDKSAGTYTLLRRTPTLNRSPTTERSPILERSPTLQSATPMSPLRGRSSPSPQISIRSTSHGPTRSRTINDVEIMPRPPERSKSDRTLKDISGGSLSRSGRNEEVYPSLRRVDSSYGSSERITKQPTESRASPRESPHIRNQKSESSISLPKRTDSYFSASPRRKASENNITTHRGQEGSLERTYSRRKNSEPGQYFIDMSYIPEPFSGDKDNSRNCNDSEKSTTQSIYPNDSASMKSGPSMRPVMLNRSPDEEESQLGGEVDHTVSHVLSDMVNSSNIDQSTLPLQRLKGSSCETERKFRGAYGQNHKQIPD
jgi:hypothetical protein